MAIQYIGTALNWVKTVSQYLHQQMALVDACTTIEDIDKLNFDLVQFSNTDPKVTIENAMKI